jgi:hypothetical protein
VGGTAGRRGDESGKRKRKLDPNSQECKDLAQKIANLRRDILERENRIDVNPGELPEIAPGPRKNSIQGHREILEDYRKNLDEKEKLYQDKCGGPPPNVAPDRPPVLYPRGFRFPKLHIPKVPVPVRPALPLVIPLPFQILRCILFGDCKEKPMA